MGIRLVLLILLLIIAAPALASTTPDTVLLQSDTEWLIAGSAELMVSSSGRLTYTAGRP